MSFKNCLLAAGSVLLLTGPVAAQSPGQRAITDFSAQKQDSFVRVQTSITFFLSGPTGEGEDAEKLRERARRIIYEMAAKECDLAREVFAKDCRLEAVNSNINVNRPHNNQPEGYNVNGGMSLQITLK